MKYFDKKETPEGLHRMQYAIHILEEVLGWPSKGNCELIADCILSIAKARKLSVKQGHDYLVRAITLAGEQGITVDRFFFMEGTYTKMRPTKDEEFKGTFEKPGTPVCTLCNNSKWKASSIPGRVVRCDCPKDAMRIPDLFETSADISKKVNAMAASKSL